MGQDNIHYRNRRGVIVTDRYMRTRHKDQSLAPVTAIRIGREPLHLALACGVGLGLFAYQFGDLLYAGEQIILGCAAGLLLVGGYSIASLELGTMLRERRMLWSDYWTVRRVRDAIVKARSGQVGDAMHTEADISDN